MGHPLNFEYLAGLLDGEGCFRFSSTPLVEICGTYPDILRQLESQYGGRVRLQCSTPLSKKRVYKWTITGPRAAQVVRQVLPFLEEKAPQADLVLRIHRYPPKSAMRAALIRELKALKRVSYQWSPEN